MKKVETFNIRVPVPSPLSEINTKLEIVNDALFVHRTTLTGGALLLEGDELSDEERVRMSHVLYLAKVYEGGIEQEIECLETMRKELLAAEEQSDG